MTALKLIFLPKREQLGKYKNTRESY